MGKKEITDLDFYPLLCEIVGDMKLTPEDIYFWQGSQACAQAAIVAGCRFFAGYPITPASEIAEHMARTLPRIGGIAIQMEDELASLGAIIGASWAGAKAMTATSGPGFSLMQEFIGYAFMTETPCVVVDVQRAGPSTGQATKCGQGDVMQSRWGTHGDYSAIVLSPNSVQEIFALTIKAFNLSEKYRTPVIVLSDETVMHMREQVSVPPREAISLITRKKPKQEEKAFFGREEIPPMPAVGDGFHVAVTGSTHDEYGIRSTADENIHRKLVERLNGKIRNHAEDFLDYEDHNIEECSVGIVTYGITSRAAYEAIEMAERKGINTGLVRLRSVWPFPSEIIRQLAENAEKIIVPELNLGQILYEVERAAGGMATVYALNKIGGGELITPEELFTKIMKAEKND